MMIRSAFAILFAVSILSGCRPSQQTRRGNTANAKNTASQTKTMDSLLMVQDKLVTVVDTMASLLAQDRKKIIELEREVARLKGIIEERALNNTQTPPPPSMNSNNLPNDRTVTGLQAAPPPVEPQASTPAPNPQNDEYTKALKQFNGGKYAEALASFDNLSRTDPNSALAPNYLYWKGESLYALGEYNEAIGSFHEVLDKFPESTKADDAEFKIGASYEKLGNTLNAKTAYQRLMLSFPSSEYSSRAEARLKKLQ